MSAIVFPAAQTNAEGAPEILPEELLPFQSQVTLIDVRRPEEFTGELGHIAGSHLMTLETDFAQLLEMLAKDKTYVMVCRSGVRSSRATTHALSRGFPRVYNLSGGMVYWNSLGLPVEK